LEWTHLAQDKVQYLDHLNLKSRGFRDRLSQACDEEHTQDMRNRQLNGTNGGLVSCRLYRMRGCADDYSQYVTSRTTYECHKQSDKLQSHFSVGNSNIGGGSNSNTRSSGSIVFIFCVKTLLVARVYFIAMESSILREQ
jgi:hypothetical protein